jgi:hypothetical protein
LDEQSRIAQDGSRGTSDSVAFLAAVNGFGLVILQVLSLAYVCKKERQEQAENKNDKREEDTRTRRFNNPLTGEVQDQPRPRWPQGSSAPATRGIADMSCRP